MGILPITRQAFTTVSEEELDLPCCPEGEEEGEGKEAPVTDYRKESYGEWAGEDRPLDLPSPPTGSISVFEGEGSSSHDMSEQLEALETEKVDFDAETEKKKEREKYYGIRVCPCKRVETEVEETEEEAVEEKEKSIKSERMADIVEEKEKEKEEVEEVGGEAGELVLSENREEEVEAEKKQKVRLTTNFGSLVQSLRNFRS